MTVGAAEHYHKRLTQLKTSRFCHASSAIVLPHFQSYPACPKYRHLQLRPDQSQLTHAQGNLQQALSLWQLPDAQREPQVLLLVAVFHQQEALLQRSFVLLSLAARGETEMSMLILSMRS